MIPGVHHLPLPTPFQIGAINAYLLDGPPLTLIDAGPHTDETMASLEAQLAELGRKVEDIEQILITHPHMDHFGLAGAIKARSGCVVRSHPDAIQKVSDFAGHYANEQDFFGKFLTSMGFPSQTAKLLTEIPKSFSVLAPPVEVDEPLDVSALLKIGDLNFELIETPGHSPASICFYNAKHKAMFAGDHLIDGITPNPLMEMPSGQKQERPKSLVLYMESLDKVNALDLNVVFSGHRNVITEPQRVIDTAYEHNHKRSDRVLGFLESTPMTAHEMMNSLFPDLPATEQFLGISEAVGHLEWLVEQDIAAATERDGVIYFEAQ